MLSISSANTGATRPLTAAGEVFGAPQVRKSSDAQGRPRKPVMDEYIPEEKQEPSGRYWIGRDEDGQPSIYFDGPSPTPDASKQPESVLYGKQSSENAPDAGRPEPERPSKGPERSGKREETCTGDTGQVDREIEKLRRKQRELEQRLNTETDEAKIKELKQQLAQVERELAEKDNDTYRRQHTRFS